MSDDKGKDAAESADTDDEVSPEESTTAGEAEPAPDPAPSPSGPKFEDSAPDPLAGFRRWSSELWDSMEGKTVSMRAYVGSLAAVIVLMLLARCGG